MCYYYAWKSRKEKVSEHSLESQLEIDSAKFYLDKAILLNKKFPMEIHFFKESLISLYLNKQWMLINEAESSDIDSMKMSLLSDAWQVAEQAMILDSAKKYMFQINQSVGWSMNGKEEKMKGMNRAIEDSYKDDKDKMAIVKNNTGVYYSNFPVGSSDTRGKQVSSASGYFSEAKEMANSHVLKYYIDRNLYSREKVYIYYYDPITDYRPRNIELNIEFRRPYFNPQVPIEISQMETFNVQDISSEECTDVKRKKVGKKRELTWWDLYRIEDVDDGVHCPLQDKK
jgi:hypothetical protein